MEEVRQGKSSFDHEFNDKPDSREKILKLSDKDFKLNKSKKKFNLFTSDLLLLCIIGLDLSWYRYLPVHSS